MADVYKNCLVCGKEFKVCNTCQKNVSEDLQWRRVVCCPAHFNFHLPIIKYIRKEIDKTKAKEMLTEAIGSFGKVDFVDNIKSVAEEILADEKVEPIQEEVIVEADVIAPTDEKPVVKQTNKKNKK